MRRGRVLLILLFVVLLIVVAILVAWRFFISQPQASQATVTPDVIGVAFVKEKKVSRGDPLDQGDLEFRDWPKDKVSDGMLLSNEVDELADAGYRYRNDINPGTPLMRGMLLAADEIIPLDGSTWSRSIPRGSVAVSVPVSRLSSVSYAPRPGDHVNVIASMLFVDLDTQFQSILPNYTGMVVSAGPPNPETGERDLLVVNISSLMPRDLPESGTGKMGASDTKVPGIYGRVIIDPVLGQAVYLAPSEEQRPRLVSHMLLQDVMVLQMGNFQLEAEKAAAAQQQQQQQQADQQQQQAPPPVVKPDVVTLIVTPQDAVTLNYLIYSGAELTLALRFPEDDIRIDTSPVTLQFLLEQYRIPVPVRLPYGLMPRLDELIAPKLPNDN